MRWSPSPLSSSSSSLVVDGIQSWPDFIELIKHTSSIQRFTLPKQRATARNKTLIFHILKADPHSILSRYARHKKLSLIKEKQTEQQHGKFIGFLLLFAFKGIKYEQGAQQEWQVMTTTEYVRLYKYSRRSTILEQTPHIEPIYRKFI